MRMMRVRARVKLLPLSLPLKLKRMPFKQMLLTLSRRRWTMHRPTLLSMPQQRPLPVRHLKLRLKRWLKRQWAMHPLRRLAKKRLPNLLLRSHPPLLGRALKNGLRSLIRHGSLSRKVLAVAFSVWSTSTRRLSSTCRRCSSDPRASIVRRPSRLSSTTSSRSHHPHTTFKSSLSLFDAIFLPWSSANLRLLLRRCRRRKQRTL